MTANGKPRNGSTAEQQVLDQPQRWRPGVSRQVLGQSMASSPLLQVSDQETGLLGFPEETSGTEALCVTGEARGAANVCLPVLSLAWAEACDTHLPSSCLREGLCAGARLWLLGHVPYPQVRDFAASSKLDDALTRVCSSQNLYLLTALGPVLVPQHVASFSAFRLCEESLEPEKARDR